MQPRRPLVRLSIVFSFRLAARRGRGFRPEGDAVARVRDARPQAARAEGRSSRRRCEIRKQRPAEAFAGRFARRADCLGGAKQQPCRRYTRRSRRDLDGEAERERRARMPLPRNAPSWRQRSISSCRRRSIGGSSANGQRSARTRAGPAAAAPRPAEPSDEQHDTQRGNGDREQVESSRAPPGPAAPQRSSGVGLDEPVVDRMCAPRSPAGREAPQQPGQSAPHGRDLSPVSRPRPRRGACRARPRARTRAAGRTPRRTRRPRTPAPRRSRLRPASSRYVTGFTVATA